jgi:hypothetical protein
MPNGSAPATVTLDLTGTLVRADGHHLPVRAALSYDLSDPYAIHAIFTVALSPQVPWVFARELLTNGMRGTAGLGDVRVWRTSPDDQCTSPDDQCTSPDDQCTSPDDQRDVHIGLISPDGEALLHFSGAELARFLSRTYAQCWPGEEHIHVDIDLAIEHLLAF